MHSRHVSRIIHAEPARVYEFAADPANLHLWAAGLADGGGPGAFHRGE